MLKKITRGRVESDDGFFIQVTGPETLKYVEGSKSIVFDCTVNFKRNKISIYVNDYKTWDTPEKKSITLEEKEKIIKNISDAVKLLEGDFEVV